MSIIARHNPDCGPSRNVLPIVKAAGDAPMLIDTEGRRID